MAKQEHKTCSNELVAPESAAADLVEIVRDGITVQVDAGYMKSWQGIRQAARMSSSQASDLEKLAAVVEYYERAVPNVDDVALQLGEGASARDVLGFLRAAVEEAMPKN